VNSFFTLPKIFSEFKYSIQLALPLIASEIIYALSGFAATIMIARLGKNYLAANALVWNIHIAIILIAIGILCAVSIMVAQSFGAKDNRGISICFKQGLIMGLIFAPILMLAMWFAPVILVWTKQDPVIIALAKPFFKSLALPMLPFCILFAIEQFLIGINKTKVVLLMSILTVPIQILFFYAFLFGKFWFPQTGLEGIGYGIGISFSLVVTFLLFYIHFAKDLQKYRLFEKWWQINKKFLSELIRVGLPLGFMFGTEVALFAVVALMMGSFGTTALAAHQIAHQYLMIALSIIFALTQTITIRVGNEVGRNNRATLKLSAFVNVGISFSFMLLFSIFYICFPRMAISLDIDIHAPHLQDLVKKASTFLSIAGVLILTDCLRLISIGALRGLKDTRFPVLISVFGFWGLAFPAAYLLAFKFKFGGAGIWWGLVIGLFTAGIILFIRFNRIVKHIDLEALVTTDD
jgi:MATE family multidrug resistance protein